jgi:hypothetical protein
MQRAGTAMTTKWSKAPDWFNPTSYDYLRELDGRGWVRELGRCAKLRDDAHARREGRPTFSDKWDSIGEPGWTEKVGYWFIGFPPVMVVDKADMASLPDLAKPALIVQVSLRATDHDIMEGFKKALMNARREAPAPAKKPGRYALSSRFNETIFARWQRHKIVQLCELDEWCSKLEKDRKDYPKHADFARWLFPERDQQDKLIFDAFRMLDSAIAEIPALTLQVGRMAKGERSLKADEGKIDHNRLPEKL